MGLRKLMMTLSTKIHRKLLFRRLLIFTALALLASIVIPHNNRLITQHSLVTRQYIFGNVKDTNGGQRLKTYYHKTLLPPGIIVRVKGGLGNQLFQYACSHALAKDLDWPLYFHHDPTPPSSFQRDFQPDHRELALDQFQIPLNNIISSSTRTATWVHYKTDTEFMERGFLLDDKNLHKRFIALGEESYCQSMEYWRHRQDEIRAMIRPHEWAINFSKLARIREKIENSLSVAVHVRRGDFTRIQGYYVPISYQRKAMQKMIDMLRERGGEEEKPTFFIFSDDIQYVKDKLKDFESDYKLEFVSEQVSNSTSIDEFYLMTLCKHIILPNSTYSWWAAFLIEKVGKIVIASAFHPAFFETVRSTVGNDMADIYGKLFHPKEWIVMDPFTGGLARNN